jgi:hypothetical protein
MTVQELRNKGFKVKVLHNRLYKGRFKWQTAHPSVIIGSAPLEPDTKGGSTHIIIDSPNGFHFEGVALCSRNDNYDKKLGVRIALGRSGIIERVNK